MKTFLIWILVSFGNTGSINYSPPMRQFEDCKKLEATVEKLSNDRVVTECIQVEMVASIATPAR